MYANSLMWGVLGSNRMFNDMYPLFKWCFLIGFLISVAFIIPQWYGPKYLPGVRERIRSRVSPHTFERLDKTVFAFVASLLWLNPILIIQGIQHWAPSNLSYKTPGMILSFIFMYWLPRRSPSHLAWWEKYTYVLSAALTAGVAIAALVMYFAVQYHPKPITWWGTTVSSAGLDGTSTGILPIPERGYFGPEKGNFPS